MVNKTRALKHNLHLTSFWSQQKKYPLFMSISIFFVVWIIGTIISYFRLPENYLYANFFAEDGQHFAQNILNYGFLHALFTTFNGYFICGVYLVTGVGFIVNHVFFGGYFVNLPNSFALASYAFFGLCAALPILLLRKYVSLFYLLSMSLLICFLPMPSFDYGTIGTIGNLKFAFLFIAFLLVLYRIKLPRTSRLIPLTDVGLLLCVYTIAEAYVVLPFILLADGVKPIQLLKRSAWRQTFRRDNIALWSLFVLGLLAFLQVAMIAVRGTPSLPGYLDQPYQVSKTIEIFFGRVLLYPFITAGYRHLNDVFVILMLVVGFIITLRFGRKSNFMLYCFGLFTILSATAVFIFNRTGVSVYYNHYQGSGFDNFFYPQNYIAIVIGLVLLADILRRFDWQKSLPIAISICVLLFAGEIHTNASYASNDFMPYVIGTLKQQAQAACQTHGQSDVQLTVYPFEFLHMTEPHERVCAIPTRQLQVGIQAFGLTTVAANALNISPGYPTFSQTFTSPRNNLSGLAIYLSTYGQERLNNYELLLQDHSCKKIIRKVAMPLRVHDNAYRLVTFKPFKNSQNQTYCFTIRPTLPTAQPFALQLSRETSYNEGVLTVDGVQSSRDVVFQAIY